MPRACGFRQGDDRSAISGFTRCRVNLVYDQDQSSYANFSPLLKYLLVRSNIMPSESKVGRIRFGSLVVAPALFDFVATDAQPGTGISPKASWGRGSRKPWKQQILRKRRLRNSTAPAGVCGSSLSGASVRPSASNSIKRSAARRAAPWISSNAARMHRTAQLRRTVRPYDEWPPERSRKPFLNARWGKERHSQFLLERQRIDAGRLKFASKAEGCGHD